MSSTRKSREDPAGSFLRSPATNRHGVPVPDAVFVDLARFDPDLRIEPRYAGNDNFLGRPAAGYLAPICLLTLGAARALANANRLAAAFGLTLKVFDGYRPQSAVDDFVGWTCDPADQRTKRDYYPRLDKRDLLAHGYISAASQHTRGSAVDVTLVRRPDWTPGASGAGTPPGARQDSDFLPGGELDMGGAFDLFDPVSRMDNPKVAPEVMRRRRLLLALMQATGFSGIAEEWWHFHLIDEPFPDTYFDFPVAPRGWLAG